MLNPSPSRQLRRHARRLQGGLSLVELMVGIAIGLFVVAAGVLGITTSLRENRLLLLEARVQQDLRATMDLVTRDARRAGYWAEAAASGVPTSTTAATPNPYVAITTEKLSPAPATSTMPPRPTPVASNTTPVVAIATTPADSITYRWDDGSGIADHGFRLNAGTIQMKIGGGAWQAVTDPNSVVITSFSITPTLTWLPLYDKCSPACVPTGGTCPEMVMRSLEVEITGRTPDSTVQRTLRSNVRVRNDRLVGACS